MKTDTITIKFGNSFLKVSLSKVHPECVGHALEQGRIMPRDVKKATDFLERYKMGKIKKHGYLAI